MRNDLIPAAVLIPILVESGETVTPAWRVRMPGGEFTISANAEIVFTVRTEKVEHHKGQISFPGGVREPHDESLQQTALRESFEEIGLHHEAVTVLGELPEVPTVASRFRVKPFLGLVHSRFEFRPNPDEIDSILRVPLSHLLDARNSVLENYDYQGVKYQIRAYHFGTHRIWGATARMLQTFLEKYLIPG